MCAGAKNPLNCWVASISLTFFVNFQFENIAYLCENFGREGGEKGDTLEESDLQLIILMSHDPGDITIISSPDSLSS